MEVNTYLKELKGKNKESESIFAIFKALRNLKNYGHGDVNFGEPINLNEILNDKAPDWRELVDPEDVVKPQWLTPVVNHTANRVMRNINDAAVLNTVNLCALTLLTSENHALLRDEMQLLIEFYVELQESVPYSDKIKTPSESGSEIIDEAVLLEKVESENDEYGTIIKLNDKNAILMSYYRNNVVHLFAIPSIVAGALVNLNKCSKKELKQIVHSIAPLLSNELFLTIEDLDDYVAKLLDWFESQGLVTMNKLNVQVVERGEDGFVKLSLLAKVMKDTLQRYALGFNRIKAVEGIQRGELERDCQKLAKRLLTLHDIKAPEYFDKKIISSFVSSIREHEYVEIDTAGLMHLSESGEQAAEHINLLLNSEILQSLKSLG